jgi:hypothetical protein
VQGIASTLLKALKTYSETIPQEALVAICAHKLQGENGPLGVYI